MKNILSTLVIMLTASVTFATLSIEGIYQGKSLYVSNPINNDGFGYSTSKVIVNGNVIPVSLGVIAFEINFENLNISFGDSVFVAIRHHEETKPRILNPEAILPSSTFAISEISVNNEGHLTWTAIEEKGKLPFFIEQYRCNKWITVGEVQGKDSTWAKSYEFQVTPHSGENKVRVVQIDQSGTKRTSKEVNFILNIGVVVKSHAD